MELEGRRCDLARRCCRRAGLGRPCPHCAHQFVSLTGAWVGWDGHAMRSMCAPPLRFGERTQAKRELGGCHRFDLVGVQQAGYDRRHHVLCLYGRRHGGPLRARGERPGRLRGSASLHVPIERTHRPRGAAKAARRPPHGQRSRATWMMACDDRRARMVERNDPGRLRPRRFCAEAVERS